MSWRLAKSLETLRNQVNAKWPNRSKSSDGSIGNDAHAATKSDHNPNSAGVVTAIDITHDPAHGLDARKLAEALVASRDPRIKYIISNGQIISSVVSPWQWRTYSGSNAHRQHVHISVNGSAGLYDDFRPWNLGEPVAKVEGRQYGITATFFGGSGDPNTSAYDGHLITDDEFGVALPYRFKGTRPKVRVFKDGKSVDCSIVDVGPWNINDPYWETGARPQAESGTDNTGRTTNHAGIDLTPAAADAIGLDGKGEVDWEFVTAGTVTPPPVDEPEPKSIDEALARIDAAVADIRRLADVATQPAPQLDWGKLLQPLLAELAPKLLPMLMPLIVQMLPQLMPYLLDAFFKPRQSVMSNPNVKAGAVGGIGAILGALATQFLQVK